MSSLLPGIAIKKKALEDLDVEDLADENDEEEENVIENEEEQLAKRREEEAKIKLREEEELKQHKSRISVLREILDSEKKYVEYLDLLWSVYFTPMLQKNDFISTKIASKFFPSDFKTLRESNAVLLKKLQERMGESEAAGKLHDVQLGDIFIEVVPLLKNYIPYNVNYQPCIDLINKIRKKLQGIVFLLRQFFAWTFCLLTICTFRI